MKNLLFTLLSLLMLSCSSVSHIAAEKVIHDKKEGFTQVSGEMIPNTQIAQPDSTKTIIVYNVIEPENKRSIISDETIRLFIADLFGTITTILTLRQLDSGP